MSCSGSGSSMWEGGGGCKSRRSGTEVLKRGPGAGCWSCVHDPCQELWVVTTFVRLWHSDIYGFCSPSHADVFLSVVTDCVNAVADWMRSNRLQLNSDKTEFMWCATVRRQHCLATSGLLIGSSTLTPSSAIRDLGVYIDSGLTMQSHVRQTVLRCLSVLRQLRTVLRQVPTSVFQSLIFAHVLSRLDYCNSVLFGLLANLIQRL